jgi:hypothetical protein
VKSGRVVCDECSTVIRGARFKCTTCADFDLCAPCEAKTQHNPEHALLKVRPPASASATAQPLLHLLQPVAAKPEEVLVSITLETPALIPIRPRRRRRPPTLIRLPRTPSCAAIARRWCAT